ncbi:hypothetical protein HWD29_gp160 [Klebsiella phage KpS8]|uniref:Uncharacterized protein n=2 Tax=Mydovirus KpS8 TaxID=2723896 RepID=A0A7L8ZJ06_9CAUD|nr:hypothetical protein HWD29_gp160 [Klebsiella phage KpS8]QIW88354.1 hypothetical protein kps8_182 [Klebsiella phage KpS8]QOI68752.1 hypothetical protein phage621_00199 [Klebsiella phage vB_KpnM_Seu621]
MKIKEKIKEDVEVFEIRNGEGFLHDRKIYIRAVSALWMSEYPEPKIPALNLHTGEIRMFYSTTKVRPSEISVEYTV